MKEYWADIAGFPSYMVSDHGRVRNWKIGLELTPRPHVYDGYRIVRLSTGGRRKTNMSLLYIHELVATSFTDVIPPGKIPVHIDGDKTNNHIDNLKWVVKPEDGSKNLVYVPGAEPGRSVMVIRILETGELFRGLDAAAKHIGGSRSAISECLNGKRSHHKGFTFERTGTYK